MMNPTPYRYMFVWLLVGFTAIGQQQPAYARQPLAATQEPVAGIRRESADIQQPIALTRHSSAGDCRQTIYGGLLTVEREASSGRQGDSLTVCFRLDASRLEMPSGRSLTLTPLIAGRDTLRLPPILLNGRNRHQVYRRNLALGITGEGDYYAVVKATEGERRQVAYRQTLPLEPWMKEARLVMEENVCGCGGHTEEITREPLFALVQAQPAPQVATPFQPAYCYLQPAPEAVKNRVELKDIYLNFPVNQTAIYPDYMRNPAELAAARQMVERINTNKNLSIREIVIRGYASPEGSVAGNRRLSEGRAAALKNYLASRLRGEHLAMRSEGGGEDWEGVIKELRAQPVAGGAELLDAILASDRSDASEQALRRVGGGEPYREMAGKIYPRVRRVVCTVGYTARAFTLEESREIIRQHPEQLSLHEMWQVADSYPENSEAFKETMRIAAGTFPSDETALLNAAQIELAEGNDDRAAGYLSRIRLSEAAPASADRIQAVYENVAGLLSMSRGDKRKAADHFRRAARAGLESARQNLAQLANDDTNNNAESNKPEDANQSNNN